MKVTAKNCYKPNGNPGKIYLDNFSDEQTMTEISGEGNTSSLNISRDQSASTWAGESNEHKPSSIHIKSPASDLVFKVEKENNIWKVHNTESYDDSKELIIKVFDDNQ